MLNFMVRAKVTGKVLSRRCSVLKAWSRARTELVRRPRGCTVASSKGKRSLTRAWLAPAAGAAEVAAEAFLIATIKVSSMVPNVAGSFLAIPAKPLRSSGTGVYFTSSNCA